MIEQGKDKLSDRRGRKSIASKKFHQKEIYNTFHSRKQSGGSISQYSLSNFVSDSHDTTEYTNERFLSHRNQNRNPSFNSYDHKNRAVTRNSIFKNMLPKSRYAIEEEKKSRKLHSSSESSSQNSNNKLFNLENFGDNFNEESQSGSDKLELFKVDQETLKPDKRIFKHSSLDQNQEGLSQMYPNPFLSSDFKKLKNSNPHSHDVLPTATAPKEPKRESWFKSKKCPLQKKKRSFEEEKC